MANNFSRNIFPHIRIRLLHSSATSPSSFTADFLVNSCGLPLKSAQSVSKKFQLNDKTPQNSQSVLQFLKSHHFSDTHVAQLIVKRPQVLNCRIHDNLKPNFDYLVKIGLEGELLPHIILSNPYITDASLASQIKPCVQFLRLFLGSDEKFILAVKRAPWLLSENSQTQLQHNVDVLMKEGGLPAHVVQRFLTLLPKSIFQTPEKLISAVNSVKNLGFESTDTKFVEALRVMIKMSESTCKKKIEVMKSMGFSEEVILKTFKRFPQCLAFSEKNIKVKLNIYLNVMELEPQTLIVNPTLLRYSIEERVFPRFYVLKVLESRKLIKDAKQCEFIRIVEKNFREKYIDRFLDEFPVLLDFYLAMKELCLLARKSGIFETQFQIGG